MTHQTTTAELPNWEALYEPGNVSTYLIGYANDQDAATGMAEAWMRSQAEVTGRLEWVDDEQMATGRYDRWFELIERHDDGVDTGPGIIVRRRVADAPEPAAVSAAVAPPTNRAALRDRIAQAIEDAPFRPDERRSLQLADAVLAVLPEAADWDALVREADRLRRDGKALHARTEEIDNQLTALRQQATEPGDKAAVLAEAIRRVEERAKTTTGLGLGWEAARDVLRRMADETATETVEPDSTTLLELVRDFLDPDPCSFDHHGYCQAHAAGFGGEPLSCPHGRARKLLADLEQPAVGARQDEPVVTVHAAPDLSPAAEEALGALIDVAKQQAVCDFEHPHPEHPCGRRTAAGARQDGAET